MGDLKKIISWPFGGPEKPKAAPEAPPPLTMEDENVNQMKDLTRRRLRSSRAAAKKLSTKSSGSTLGY